MTKYSSWMHYFRFNRWSPHSFCPPQAPSLSGFERDIIASSLPQFQLGEGSDGAGLLQRAGEMSRKAGATNLELTMESFIREEQRHSAVLGLYLDREQIPRLGSHWIDGWFRKIRNLAGFELMITILTIAELIAIPYYTAVHDATRCLTLKRICRRILLDEAQHLEFQADNVSLCIAERGALGRVATLLLHWMALTAAAILVYAAHRKLFRAANMAPLAFWAMAFRAHHPIFCRLTESGRIVVREAGAYLR